MINRSLEEPVRSQEQLLHLVAAGIAGLLLGVISALLSPLWALAGLAAIFGVLILIKHPVIGVLAIIVLNSTIIGPIYLPGFETIWISDVILAGLLALIVLRWMIERDFKPVRSPIYLPIIVFLVISVIASILGVVHGRTELWAAFTELRIVGYFLLAFVVLNLTRGERQLNILFNGIVVLGIVVAITMLAQFTLGTSSTFLPGRVETLRTQTVTFAGITRILPPGRATLLVAFIVLAVLQIVDRRKPGSVFAQWAVLAVGLVLTFLRSYWLASIAVFALLALVVKGQNRQRLLVWAGRITIAVMVVVVLAGFLSPESLVARTLEAATDRFNTIIRPWTVFTEDLSFRWRYAEYEYAIPQITSHPVLGIGMGARYRPRDPRLDGGFRDLRRYIHNGHLHIMMKTGILGYLALIWISLVFLRRGFRYWRSVADRRLQATTLGFVLCYCAVLLIAIVDPVFRETNWTTLLGLMIGFNEAVFYLYPAKEQAAPQPGKKPVWIAPPRANVFDRTLGRYGSYTTFREFNSQFIAQLGSDSLPVGRTYGAGVDRRIAEREAAPGGTLIADFVKYTTINSLSKFSTIVFGMVTIMIVTRHFPAENLGSYYITLIIASFLGTFGTFGLNFTAITRFLTDAQDAEYKRKLFNTSLYFQLLAMFIAALITFPFRAQIAQLFGSALSPEFVIFIPAIFFLDGTNQLLKAALQGFMLFTRIAISEFIGSISFLLMVLALLLWSRLDIFGILLARTISFGLSLLYTYFSIPTKKVIEFHFDLLKNVLTFGFPLYLNGILTFIFQRMDTLIVGILLGPAGVAYYEIARSIPEKLRQVYIAFRSVFFPIVSGLFLQGNTKKASQVINTVTRLISFTCVVGALISILFGRQLVTLFFSEEYLPSVPAFILLMTALGVSLVSSTLGYSLVAVGDSNKPVMINIAHTAITLASNLLFIPALGLVGAALATLVSAVPANLLNVFFLSRRDVKIRVLDYYKPFTLLGACAAIVFVLNPTHVLWKAAIFVGFVLASFGVSLITLDDIETVMPELRRLLYRPVEVLLPRINRP
jgi:O-antigen/teichoic acid export membrane protein